MMKVLSYLLLVFCSSISAEARMITSDPYLPPAVPTKFVVVLDNGNPVDSAPISAGGGLALGFNVDNIAGGIHEIKAQACDAAGCSAFSEVFTFPGLPLPAPTNIRCDPVCSVIP